MGVAQHHDAVSGTEKQNVVEDFAQRLSYGIDVAVVSKLGRIYEVGIRIYLLECDQYCLYKTFTKRGSTTIDSNSISLSILQHQRVSTNRRTKSSK
jgi:hypothetical protein